MPTITVEGFEGGSLGRLLQLSSASLPVGAFAYSEGLERLVWDGVIQNTGGLLTWLEDHLRYGPIRVEAAILRRVYEAAQSGDEVVQVIWDAWVSASRESEELRQQSRDMGRALWRIYQTLADTRAEGRMPENFVTAYALVAMDWRIPLPAATYAYLHSWANNLVTAGVKLVPLGQLAGQELLWQLQGALGNATGAALSMEDDELCAWGAGLALASMRHETQYSRLFRS